MPVQPGLLGYNSTCSSQSAAPCTQSAGGQQSPMVTEINGIANQNDAEKCKACGHALDADESFAEHIVSVHLTVESSCNVCGEYSDDFIEHFKIHMEIRGGESESEPLVSIKRELFDTIKLEVPEDNKDLIVEDVSVNHEKEHNVGSVASRGKVYINPFYFSMNFP